MSKSEHLYAPEIFGRLKPSWNENEFKSAVKRFNHSAPSVPIPRLYDAYKWLKEQIDINDAASEKQFSVFIEHFLRILEDRGAAQSDVYSEVLRDSDEYKYLKGLFHSEEIDEPPVEKHAKKELPAPPTPKVKKITLKSILRDRKAALAEIDPESWRRLIDEHLMPFKNEEAFVMNCSRTVNSINSRELKEQYHIEIIAAYAFERLVSYKKLSVKSKNFAMGLLNMMSEKSEFWALLHKDYREIIKK